MSTEEKNKGGRPSDFKDEYCEQAYKLCLLGHTDIELAKFFEVCEATINNWKHDYPKFLESLRKGKELADADVAESLFNRALGYSHSEVKFATHEGKITDEKEYIKHYAPDTGAIALWLKNRQSNKWRDKQEIDHKNDGGKFDASPAVIITKDDIMSKDDLEDIGYVES